MSVERGSSTALSRSLLVLVCLTFASVRSVLALPPGFRDEGVVSEKQTVGFNFVPSPRSNDVDSHRDSNGNHYTSSGDSDSNWLLLTTRKKGHVVAVLDPSRVGSHREVVLDLEDRICTEGERGVYQVLPHPNFVENQFVYVFYTYDKHGGCKFSATDGPVNAVSRFTLKENVDNLLNTDTNSSSYNSTLQMVDETMIFETNPLPSKVHNGGDMKFGNDGYLYITLGNGGLSVEYNNAQKSNTLLGSIIRIKDDGGIPVDNPFQADTDMPCGVDGTILPENGRCSEIWATGFRNPFRFALDPNTDNSTAETRFYVNDVGGSFFEEINEVNGSSSSPGSGSDFHGGLNYGYREREGPCKRQSNQDCTPQPEYVDPLYWYEHLNRTDACMTGGAFVPNELWPEVYSGQYLFADFIFRTISLLREDPEQLCRDCSPPTPAFSKELFSDLKDIGQPLQMTFGPYKDTQALYYSLWAPKDEFSIRRIIYVGGNDPDESNVVGEEEKEAEDDESSAAKENTTSTNTSTNTHISDNDTNETETHGEEKDQKEKLEDDRDRDPDMHPAFFNSAPDAEIRIEGSLVEKYQNYGIDEVLIFEATESTDPDGDVLVYSWNFGDGTGSTKGFITHAYGKAGQYRVKLTVQDVHGFTDSTSRLITIGSLPEPSIDFPRENLDFAVGDELMLVGRAIDGDGYYIEDSNLSWEVQQWHNTHYHPFLDPTIGNLIKAPPAPSPEDFHASTNSFLRVLLTATDPKTNLTGTIVRDVMPKTKTLYFGTDPPGLELTLDGFDIKTPEETGIPLKVVTWINHNFTIDVQDQGNMIFDGWSDGTKNRYSKTLVRDEADFKRAGNDKIITARFVQYEGVSDRLERFFFGRRRDPHHLSLRERFKRDADP